MVKASAKLHFPCLWSVNRHLSFIAVVSFISRVSFYFDFAVINPIWEKGGQLIEITVNLIRM